MLSRDFWSGAAEERNSCHGTCRDAAAIFPGPRRVIIQLVHFATAEIVEAALLRVIIHWGTDFSGPRVQDKTIKCAPALLFKEQGYILSFWFPLGWAGGHSLILRASRQTRRPHKAMPQRVIIQMVHFADTEIVEAPLLRVIIHWRADFSGPRVLIKTTKCASASLFKEQGCILSF